MTKRECVSKPVILPIALLSFPSIFFSISPWLCISFQLPFKFFYHIYFISCSTKWIFFSSACFPILTCFFWNEICVLMHTKYPKSTLLIWPFQCSFFWVCASFWSWTFFSWMRLNEWKVYLLAGFTFLLYFFHWITCSYLMFSFYLNCLANFLSYNFFFFFLFFFFFF